MTIKSSALSTVTGNIIAILVGIGTTLEYTASIGLVTYFVLAFLVDIRAGLEKMNEKEVK